MAQPFILRLSDNLTTVDFLSSSYIVGDGGFDISMPRVKRELTPQRPGFYVPLVSYYEYREAKLRFQIRGATRSAVLASLNTIERILRNFAARTRLAAGRRGELTYAWAGANNITYFEVFSGEVSFPSDVLSVAKIHATQEGNYILPDCELSLYLSGTGYGISIFSDALTEIPLYNPSVGSKQTGGVRVQNPGYYKSGANWLPQHNWVEIDGLDLPGTQPLITKFVLQSDTPYSNWSMVYMGLQQSPYPTKLVFDDSELVWGHGGTINDDSASQGSYRSAGWGNQGPFYSFFASHAWSVSNPTVGMFFAFLHAYMTVPNHFQFAVGVDDYVSFGIRFTEDYITPYNSSATVPLGAIQLPPTSLELKDYGTIHPDLWLGLWVAGEYGDTFTIDYLSMLPIANGLRIWRSRVSNLTGTLVDDGWRGLEYVKNAQNQVATPFYGLLEPLKLEPGVTQRIYFTSTGYSFGSYDRTRAFKVQIFVVPTYLTLAL